MSTVTTNPRYQQRLAAIITPYQFQADQKEEESMSQITTSASSLERKSVSFSSMFLLFVAFISLGIGVYVSRYIPGMNENKNGDEHATKKSAVTEKSEPKLELETTLVNLPESQWKTAGIVIEPAKKSPFQNTVRLTGKVSLNQDRVAHIYPMVEGIVDSVNVRLGQNVNANELLVTIHSPEIGKTKLELYQARLQLEMAKTKDKMQVEINKNATELLSVLKKGETISSIELQFRNRGMGDYRERLLLSYSNYLKSEADVRRLESVGNSEAISGKQLILAKTNLEADLATYQARIEQIQYELTTSMLISSQAVKQAETLVAVCATNLKILGCSDEDIIRIDPDKQGEAISDYSIRSPFNGVVLTKDLVLKEHVMTDAQILSIADLSTVWVDADVYETHVPILNSLTGKTIDIYNEAWPDKIFKAKIFYTGDVMDEKTRTISMRAETDNKERLLKPGMFVNITLPTVSPISMMQLPSSAVLEHQGVKFVFVQTQGEIFERRNVETGSDNGENIIIQRGVSEGDKVVTKGGFVLKSKLLASLMGEE